MTQEEIDALLKGDTGDDADAGAGIVVDAPSFPELPSNEEAVEQIIAGDSKLSLLYDLQLPVSIELGRTNMLIRDILRLGRGSVVEFDKLVSEPVDVLVNGKKVAEGEVVVVDKHFGIRITTLVDPTDRLRNLKR
ncbi:MAG: flagellar motor switch protein FliN [Ignavibacteria bacterium]|nr:flagellar motor switch protein FliN [Ignavibacteria bacterium]